MSIAQSTILGFVTILLALTGCDLEESQFRGDVSAQRASAIRADQDIEQLISLAIRPERPVVAVGDSLQTSAFALMTDATAVDVSDKATWTVEDTSILAVDAKGMITGQQGGVTRLIAEFEGATAEAEVWVTSAALEQVLITPASSTIPAGTNQSFTLTGMYADGTTQDLTSSASWSSAEKGIASFASPAVVTGHTPGQTKVTATYRGKKAEADLTVTNAFLTGLEISPATATIPAGLNQQFSLTGTFSDGSKKDLTNEGRWESSDPATAIINLEGLLTGLRVGTVNITARVEKHEASAAVNITAALLSRIRVEPQDQRLPIGMERQFSATGDYSDGTSQDLTASATWSSSAPSVASIAPNARARALTNGNAVISATFGGVTGSANLEVIDAVLLSLTVTPPTATLPNGTTFQFTALGTYSDSTTPRDVTSQAIWISNDTAIATVGNDPTNKGLVTGMAVNSATITASIGSNIANATVNVTPATLNSITITPDNHTVNVGRTQTYIAEGSYSDGSVRDITASVIWSVANADPATPTPAFASISNAAGSEGTATGLAVGDAVVTATLGSVSDTATLRVDPAVIERISIAPATASVEQDRTLQLEAYAHYSDGSSQLVTSGANWSSVNTAIATVSDSAGTRGLVRGISSDPAPVEIRATFSSQTGTAAITVTDPVFLSLTMGSSAQNIIPTMPAFFFVDDSLSMSQSQAFLINGMPQFLDGITNTAGTPSINLDVYVFTTSSLTQQVTRYYTQNSDGTYTEVSYSDATNAGAYRQVVSNELATVPANRTVSFRTTMSVSEFETAKTALNAALDVGTSGSNDETGACNMATVIESSLVTQGEPAAITILSDEEDSSSVNNCVKSTATDYTWQTSSSNQLNYYSCTDDCNYWGYKLTYTTNYLQATCTYNMYQDGVFVGTSDMSFSRHLKNCIVDGSCEDNASCTQGQIAYMEQFVPGSCITGVQTCQTDQYANIFTKALFGENYETYGYASLEDMRNADPCTDPIKMQGVWYDNLEHYYETRWNYRVTPGSCHKTYEWRRDWVPSTSGYWTSASAGSEYYLDSSIAGSVKAAADAKFGENNYTFSAIIRDPVADVEPEANCPLLTAGASYGSIYRSIADMTGGSVLSICNNSYERALSSTLDFIRQVALQSYAVTLPTGATIEKVELMRGQQIINVEIDTDVFIDGHQLQFVADVVQPNDQIKVYYREALPD